MYKMHFHYRVMHARKEVNAEVEKAIQENVRVEREWSSTSKAKNTVDFRKVDGIIEKDNVFGGDDDMTKVYRDGEGRRFFTVRDLRVKSETAEESKR